MGILQKRNRLARKLIYQNNKYISSKDGWGLRCHLTQIWQEMKFYEYRNKDRNEITCNLDRELMLH